MDRDEFMKAIRDYKNGPVEKPENEEPEYEEPVKDDENEFFELDDEENEDSDVDIHEPRVIRFNNDDFVPQGYSLGHVDDEETADPDVRDTFVGEETAKIFESAEYDDFMSQDEFTEEEVESFIDYMSAEATFKWMQEHGAVLVDMHNVYDAVAENIRKEIGYE